MCWLGFRFFCVFVLVYNFVTCVSIDHFISVLLAFVALYLFSLVLSQEICYSVM